jgi:hypothetical protein
MVTRKLIQYNIIEKPVKIRDQAKIIQEIIAGVKRHNPPVSRTVF